VKFYVSALIGVIIKVILQNARCNVKDKNDNVFIRAEIRTRCHVGLEYYERGLYGLHAFNVTVMPAFIQGVPGGI